jgi:peroxiredoxin
MEAINKRTRSLKDSRIKRDGLSKGTVAPLFDLPRLDGTKLSLKDYRGHRILLVFSDPNCGPCNQLAPQLEQLHRRVTDLKILMISRGDLEANRLKADEHELTFPIVLQQRWEISREYEIFATPVGYLIDEQGIIAADVAMGNAAIIALTTPKEELMRERE